nr:hypothetical protein Iba_chr02cCG9490 [Ipomoea batatas]GMC64320.1 hypothetical protein Iba_chr02dCG3840 [Ipomoea batatas]
MMIPSRLPEPPLSMSPTTLITLIRDSLTGHLATSTASIAELRSDRINHNDHDHLSMSRGTFGTPGPSPTSKHIILINEQVVGD